MIQGIVSIMAFMFYCVATVFVLDCIVDWIAVAITRSRKRRKDES